MGQCSISCIRIRKIWLVSHSWIVYNICIVEMDEDELSEEEVHDDEEWYIFYYNNIIN